jgi:hypothetical protein
MQRLACALLIALWLAPATGQPPGDLSDKCGPGSDAIDLDEEIPAPDLDWASCVRGQEPSRNIIVTADSPLLRINGMFRSVDAYLSRSKKVLKSDGGYNNITVAAGINDTGYYRVHVWWPQALTDAGPVRVLVRHKGGTTQSTIDQRRLGGQWNAIGVFELGPDEAHASVQVADQPGVPAYVDAVRFEYLGATRPPLHVETQALPLATRGSIYSASVEAIGGTAPYTWSLSSGQLPSSLILGASDGSISGTPTVVGRFRFVVKITDAAGKSREKPFTIHVVESGSATQSSGKLSLSTTADRLNSVQSGDTASDLSTLQSIIFALPDGGSAKVNLNAFSDERTAADPRPLKARSNPTPGTIIVASATQSSGSLSLSSADTAPDLSALRSIISALPEGGWAKVNLNAFSDVWAPADLRPLKGRSNPTPGTIIVAWSSFAWDRNRGELWLYGGGHANYSGNDVYRWRGTSQLWERASLPSEIKQDDLGNWTAVDGPDAAPSSAHTYDNNVFLPFIDRFLVLGGAAYNNGGAFKRQETSTTSRRTGPYFFDPSKADADKVGGTTGSHVQRVAPHTEIVGGDMWQNRDIYVNIPGSPPLPATHINGCTAYVEENGKDVVYVGANSGSTAQALYRYTVNDVHNPALDTWEQVGRYWSTGTDQPACAYDPILNVFVKRINNASAAPFGYWDLNTPGPTNKDVPMTPVDPTGEFEELLATNAISLRHCGLDFDPVRRNFLLWCGDARVWALTPPATLSPSGWVIQRQATPSQDAVPNGDVGTGIIGKWKYIEELDAFLGLQDHVKGNIWVYKPPGATTPPGSGNALPVVTISSPANGATFAAGQSINISADATDSDDGIARVEFFAGTLKLGQATASPYTFTWIDAPPGSHTLTAVAFDTRDGQGTSPPVAITVLEPDTAGTVTLQNGVNGYSSTRDTYLSSYHPTLVFGSNAYIIDQYSRYAGLLRFAVFNSEGGPIPDGATIHTATLAVYKSTPYNMTYAVHRLLREWSEDSATWQQSRPGQPWAVAGAGGSGTDYAPLADAQFTVGWDPAWLNFDVTSAIQQMSAGEPNRGWKLVPVSGYLSGLKRFHTKEVVTTPDLRPKLTISYSIDSP